LPIALQLFQTFHKDAMLAEDVLGLIKILGNGPNNTTFE
jgi:hypothetical protein